MNMRKQHGQAAVLVAFSLPILIAFTLLVVEVAERWLEVAMVEDALQQSTRSTVQLLDYATLAKGKPNLRASTACRSVTAQQRSPCRALLRLANTFLITNLTGVRGLAEEPSTLASRVRWTVLPNGGTCAYSSSARPAVTQTTPLLCAEVRPRMRGIVGWGDFTPLITAADTVDMLDN